MPADGPSYPPLPAEFLFGVATADHQCEAYEERYADMFDAWERELGLTPRTIAVYCALLAGSVRTSADSKSFVGGIVVSITACRSASGWFFQSSFAAIVRVA